MGRLYTEKEMLEAIDRAFYSGLEQGEDEYGGEAFLAEDYLPDQPNNKGGEIK